MSTHSLRLWGPPALLDREGAPVTGRAAHRHRLALLALLATAPGHAMSRDKLMAYLWPEADARRARHLLNVSVHILRKAFGDDVLLSEGDDVRLHVARLTVDVVEFCRALDRGQPEAAVALRTGPFLDGFHLQGTPEFEKWLDGERARLRSLYRQALEKLAAGAERESEWTAAVEWRRRLAAEDPYNTRHVLQLMLALEAAGDRGNALQLAAAHETLLREDLGAEPEPELLDLVRRLREEPNGAKLSLGVPSREAAPPAVSATLGNLEASKERPKSRRHRLQSAPYLLLPILLIGAGVFLYGTATPTDREFVVQRVVVLAFENQTGDPALDPLGQMAADWIIRGLVNMEGLEVVSSPAAAPGPAAGGGAGGGTIEALRSVAAETGAGTLVQGSYYRDGSTIRIQTHVWNIPGGRLIGSLPLVSATPDALSQGVEEVRQRVMSLLAAHFAVDLWPFVRAISSPPLYEAYVEYVAGVRATESGKFRETLAHFARAYALDTTFLKPAVFMYQVGNTFPSELVADSLADFLRDRVGLLSMSERYDMEAADAYRRGDPQGFYEAAKRSCRLSPDKKWYLVAAALGLGRYREAVEVELGPGFWDDPSAPVGDKIVWKHMTTALHVLEAHREELALARQGKARHPGEMRFLEMETRALAALGRLEELERVVEEGLGLSPPDGQMQTETFLLLTGNELLWHGHTRLARDILRRAEAILREKVGDEDSDWRSMAHLAQTLLFLERWVEARAMSERGMARAPDPVDPGYWSNLKSVTIAAAKAGDREAAVRMVDKYTAAIEGRPDAVSLKPLPTFIRAEIAGAVGDCGQAVRLLKEALAQGFHRSLIHGRPGFMDCREDPAFQQVVRARG